MRAALIIAVGWVACVASLKGDTAEELFTKNCVPCHGKDGKGNTPAGKKAGAKDLTVSTTSPSEIEKQISDGKIDPKRKTNMPAFKDRISAEDVKSLAGYVLRLRKGK